MKLYRLIGIIETLLQRDGVTAPYLAEKFEVSRRTINRDIEELCIAGIPIETRQGVGGGISISENYKISRTMLTGTEMQDILAGLRGLDSVNGTDRYRQLMDRLSVDSYDVMTGNQSVLIDLSSWYGESLTPKIQIIRTAIEEKHLLAFRYYSQKGEATRTVEPYFLLFRWSSWYLWGWCRRRDDFRLIKLNRMDQLKMTDKTFEARKAEVPDLRAEKIFPGEIKVKALFEPECKWRLVDEFGPDCFEEQPDGKLLFHADYTDKENLMTWFMTFRDRAVLLEPAEIRDEIKDAVEKMKVRYEEHTI